MPSIKLTLIGAGSAFAFHVVSDLIRRPALAGSEIALVDLNPEALDLATRITRRMVAESGADLRITSTTERREVLADSDFVLNSISVGEPWARERDVAIGEEYGIYQPTSQTVGPAGFMRGMRVIPHVVGHRPGHRYALPRGHRARPGQPAGRRLPHHDPRGRSRRDRAVRAVEVHAADI